MCGCYDNRPVCHTRISLWNILSCAPGPDGAVLMLTLHNQNSQSCEKCTISCSLPFRLKPAVIFHLFSKPSKQIMILLSDMSHWSERHPNPKSSQEHKGSRRIASAELLFRFKYTTAAAQRTAHLRLKDLGRNDSPELATGSAWLLFPAAGYPPSFWPKPADVPAERSGSLRTPLPTPAYPTRGRQTQRTPAGRAKRRGHTRSTRPAWPKLT